MISGAGAPAPDVSGRYDSYEAFAEVIAPALEGLPLVKSFQIEAGARFSDYSTTGSSVTWKAGGNWIINDDYRIRSVFQRAVRSPNIGELFAPHVVGLNNLTTDPCQQALPVGNAALTALCVATGVPAGLIGAVIPPIAGQVNQTTGGDPLLDLDRRQHDRLDGVQLREHLPGHLRRARPHLYGDVARQVLGTGAISAEGGASASPFICLRPIP